MRLRFIFLGIFLLFYLWLNAHKGLDPDFGWHVRIGEMILTNGVPLNDPFSYTMPSYLFVNHEWLTDLFLAGVFPYIGVEGLLVIFSFIAFAAVSIQALVTKSKWVIVPYTLSTVGLLIYVGIRPQLLSWLIFSLLLVVLLRDALWKKYRVGLPVLFIFWANVHGGFALGIVVTGITVIARWVERKRVDFVDWGVICACFFATLLNPYGMRMWGEIFASLYDNSLRWSITEWLPAFFMFNYGFLLLFPLSSILVAKYWKSYSLVERALYLVLLLFGLSSLRHIPFWLLIAIPITTKALELLYHQMQKESKGMKRFFFGYKVFVFIVIGTVVTDFGFSLQYLTVSPLTYYPTHAIQFLKTHPSRGNVFADYELGGYMIWQLPEKKVFVDGRMPSWKREMAPIGESTDAFLEYNQIVVGDMPLADVFPKYQIDTVMLLPDQDIVLKALAEKTFRIRLSNKQRLHEQLKRIGMRIIYNDSYVTIYRR